MVDKEDWGVDESRQKEEAEEIKQKTISLKSKSKDLAESLHQYEFSLKKILYTIPNIPNYKVPAGNTEKDNEIVFEYGTTPSLYDGALPHWDLIKKYDIIDFNLGSKVTGAGFPFYKGKGARLQRALVNFF